MKKLFLSLLLVAAVAGATAQKRDDVNLMISYTVDGIAAQQGYSDEQKVKLVEALTERADQSRAVFSNKELTADEKKAKSTEIAHANAKKINAITGAGSSVIIIKEYNANMAKLRKGELQLK